MYMTQEWPGRRHRSAEASRENQLSSDNGRWEPAAQNLLPSPYPRASRQAPRLLDGFRVLISLRATEGWATLDDPMRWSGS